MTRWQWTPEQCLRQLDMIGVRVSLDPTGDNLLLDIPDELDFTDDMKRVVQKYKPGIVSILQAEERENYDTPIA